MSNWLMKKVQKQFNGGQPFQQTVLKQLDIYGQKNEPGTNPHFF